MASKIISGGMSSGHKEIIGETIAKLRLFYEGFNVYSRFLDIDAVDFVIRKRKGKAVAYKEIQMKYSKHHMEGNEYWYGIGKNTFERRANFFFMFICGDMDKIFIIPSIKLHNWLKKMLGDVKKWHIIIRERKNMWYMITKREHENINITEYLNDFKSLE